MAAAPGTCRAAAVLVAPLLAMVTTGCYVMRSSRGGAESEFTPPRPVDPADVAVPDGYRVEVVAGGLTFPTGIAFDAAGVPHVVESGYSYGEVWTTPRLLRFDGDRWTVLAQGDRNGPWTGVAFHDGAFYVAEGGALEGGRLLRIERDGRTRVLVDGLPSFGDHHTNGPAIGPDGWVYVGQGTATNSGVVGEDNFRFGWAKRRPDFHDVPGEDVVLAGENFTTDDPLRGGRATTGAFLPFGTPSTPGQVIRGQVKCSGGLLRVRADGSGAPELVAWGFRNPFGLAFGPDGALYVTDNGYDDRGSRPAWGTPDLLWRVRPGAWYGWPDWSGHLPLSADALRPPGKDAAKPLLVQTSERRPPTPVASFPVHCSADGLDFSRSPRFGHVGQAFVALLGDETPATGKLLGPTGFRVVRVDVESGVVEDFAVNRGRRNGPASLVGGGGLERPVAVRFDPSGTALWVVDFGVLTHDAEGATPREGTGVLWRIVRE
jgi:glucose/arabinose dehydrogenase